MGDATFVELPSDQELEVIGVDTLDQMARVLASASQRMFGEHLTALEHDETVMRTVEGAERKVDVVVTYGAGGTRIETDKTASPEVKPQDG
jgi:hypothetical protein